MTKDNQDNMSNTFFKNIDQMHQAILMNEIRLGQALQEKAHQLFPTFRNSNYDMLNKHVYEELFQEMYKFEESVISFDILAFLYPVMARVALNSFDVATALIYAQAALEFNRKNNDNQGVSVSLEVIIDAACMLSAFNTAISIAEENPGVISKETIQFLKKQKSENDEGFLKNLKTKKRPSCLKFCLNDELRREEGRIRLIMKAMHVSRTTAEEQFKQYS